MPEVRHQEDAEADQCDVQEPQAEGGSDRQEQREALQPGCDRPVLGEGVTLDGVTPVHRDGLREHVAVVMAVEVDSSYGNERGERDGAHHNRGDAIPRHSHGTDPNRGLARRSDAGREFGAVVR